MGVHPHPDGSPQVIVLVSEAASGGNVMLELQELGRSPVRFPGHVVVQLQRDCGIGFVACATQEFNERPL
jgi:hypothetical protein